jgi:hypothetical protein
MPCTATYTCTATPPLSPSALTSSSPVPGQFARSLTASKPSGPHFVISSHEAAAPSPAATPKRAHSYTIVNNYIKPHGTLEHPEEEALVVGSFGGLPRSPCPHLSPSRPQEREEAKAKKKKERKKRSSRNTERTLTHLLLHLPETTLPD